MAKITKKPSRKGNKGKPPAAAEASSNLTNLPHKQVKIKKDLNFKVDPDFKRDFKRFAVDHDMTMHDLLIKIFKFYKASKA